MVLLLLLFLISLCNVVLFLCSVFRLFWIFVLLNFVGIWLLVSCFVFVVNLLDWDLMGCKLFFFRG